MRIEDSCLGLIQFANGAQATIESDLTPRETASINCNFYGTEGVIQVDENAVKLMNASTNGWKQLSTFEWKDSFRDAFLAQANGIADWLDGTVEDVSRRGEERLRRDGDHDGALRVGAAQGGDAAAAPDPRQPAGPDGGVRRPAVLRPGKYDIRLARPLARGCPGSEEEGVRR